MNRRVVITGTGLITAVGKDVQTTWSSLLAGRSGVDTIQQFDPLLEVLAPKTRRLVARDNFVNLMDRMAELRRTADLAKDDARGIVLPVDYRYPEYADMPRLTDDESFVRSRLKRDDDADNG